MLPDRMGASFVWGTGSMFEKFEKKAVNLFIFADLARMNTKMPTDFTKVKRIQDKKVHALAKKAYRILFYREHMYTANSMNCLSEAVGIALPGNGTGRQIGRASCRERV